MHKPLRTVVNVAVLSILAAGAAHAGSFSLYTESSAAAIGNYAAGVATEAADASTGWYNPAGLSLLHNQQAVFGGVGVFPSSKLTGTSTFAVKTPPLPPYIQSFSGVNGAENGFVPSFHYALPLGEKTTFGFSIVSPWGLSTDWGDSSPVRYEATLSELITMNFAPELGTRLTENFAVGAGLDMQYSRVKLNRIIGIPTLVNGLSLNTVPANADDTLSYNKGSSFGVGYHIGVMGLFNNEHTRLGLNYQSRVRQQFNGYSNLSGPLASSGILGNTVVLPYGLRHNNNLSSDAIQFPDVITLSAYHDLNDSLALLSSVVYTGWSCFDQISLNNVPAPLIKSTNAGIAVAPVNVNASTPENYNSAWRVALGANYRLNQQWMLRVGGGYDETPTNNIDRDVRLPDVDRWALSLGAHYQAKPNLGVDVGYTHLFAVNDSKINNVAPLSSVSSYTVNATGAVHADLVGAQVVWSIDQPAPSMSK